MAVNLADSLTSFELLVFFRHLIFDIRHSSLPTAYLCFILSVTSVPSVAVFSLIGHRSYPRWAAVRCEGVGRRLCCDRGFASDPRVLKDLDRCIVSFVLVSA